MTEQERAHRQRMIDFATWRNTQTYSCPVCADDVEVGEHSRIVICESCATKLRVDPDASFDGGLWHDLTRLVPI